MKRQAETRSGKRRWLAPLVAALLLTAAVAVPEASGLTWAELARQLGTTTLNVWRWRGGVRPNAHHLLALQDLARRLDLAHLLPGARVQEHR